MTDSEPDIYFYKMVADNGGAPCISGNLLSLAICKPKIRKTAGKRSLVFGFGGKGYKERDWQTGGSGVWGCSWSLVGPRCRHWKRRPSEFGKSRGRETKGESPGWCAALEWLNPALPPEAFTAAVDELTFNHWDLPQKRENSGFRMV